MYILVHNIIRVALTDALPKLLRVALNKPVDPQLLRVALTAGVLAENLEVALTRVRAYFKYELMLLKCQINTNTKKKRIFASNKMFRKGIEILIVSFNYLRLSIS